MLKQYKFFKKCKTPAKTKKLKRKKWRKAHHLIATQRTLFKHDVRSIQNHYLQVHGTVLRLLHSADGEGIGREL